MTFYDIESELRKLPNMTQKSYMTFTFIKQPLFLGTFLLKNFKWL